MGVNSRLVPPIRFTDDWPGAHTFLLRIALRIGAIVRGPDLTEDEVKAGEKIAAAVRNEVLRSGDEKLIGIIRELPDESWGHLKKIMNAR